MAFVYNPVTGLLDTAVYPSTPASETAARQQFMDLFYQARDYMNNSLTAKVSGAATWIAPTLINSWTNIGGLNAPAGYYKDDLGIVRLRGVLTGGVLTTGTSLFVLPVGYRPAFRSIRVIYVNSSTGTLVVGSDGIIVIDAVSSNASLGLDTITFRAEQ